MSGLLYLIQRGGAWAGPQPAHAPPRCTKCKTANPSTASVAYQSLYFCIMVRCSVPIKGLKYSPTYFFLYRSRSVK